MHPEIQIAAVIYPVDMVHIGLHTSLGNYFEFVKGQGLQ